MRTSQIPEHLRHLRTDPEFGRPVPWINTWWDGKTQVDISRYGIGYDKATRSMAAYYHDDPANDVRADFTRQCMQRQRASMVYGLCQVCARPVDWGARALVVSTISVEQIDLHAQKAMVITEPWLDPDCAYFAQRWCPGLIGRKNELDLIFVPVNSPDECQLVMSNGWIEGPYEQATRENPVAIWAKVILFEGEQKLRGILATPARSRDRSEDFRPSTDRDLAARLPPDLRLD